MWEGMCVGYGYAQERDKKQSLTVCGNDIHQRARSLYMSDGNEVTVHLETQEDHYFLLRYEGKYYRMGVTVVRQ